MGGKDNSGVSVKMAARISDEEATRRRIQHRLADRYLNVLENGNHALVCSVFFLFPIFCSVSMTYNSYGANDKCNLLSGARHYHYRLIV